MPKFSIAAALAAIFVFISPAAACDLCAIYTAQELKDPRVGAFSTGVFEQFTSFHDLQDDGKHLPNPLHQSMRSSVTQLYGRYDFSQTFGTQINVPYISRDFNRAEDGLPQSGNESGIGDISLMGLYSPVRVSDGDFFFRLSGRAGVKLPSGDASRLREETEEEHSETEAEESEEEVMVSDRISEKHAGHHEEEIASGIHGHDLALGSGSFDYIFGTTAFAEKGNYFTVIDAQYAIRTEGDFDYRYENDLTWSVGGGRYLVTEHEATVSVEANLSGEYKGMDVFRGEKATDTGIFSLFLGPEIHVTAAENLAALAAVDIPLEINNTDIQSVPDYRLRFSVTYRF